MKAVDITSTGNNTPSVILSNTDESKLSSITKNTLTFDPAEFVAYVAPLNLTNEQANELLGAIWSIMVAFVDLGFGIHPIQQAQNASNGHVNNSAAALDHESALVVSCRETFNTLEQDKAGLRPKARRAARTDS